MAIISLPICYRFESRAKATHCLVKITKYKELHSYSHECSFLSTYRVSSSCGNVGFVSEHANGSSLFTSKLYSLSIASNITVEYLTWQVWTSCILYTVHVCIALIWCQLLWLPAIMSIVQFYEKMAIQLLQNLELIYFIIILPLQGVQSRFACFSLPLSIVEL